MQLCALTKQNLGVGGGRQSSIACRVVVCVALILLLEPAQFFQASADTDERTSGGTAGGWAGPGRCL